MNQKPLTKEDVDQRIEEYLSTYRKVLKAFLGGLVLFFVIVISGGLISKKNLITLIHDSVFRPDDKIITEIGKTHGSEVAVSYHRSFVLRNIDQNEKMLFYATPGQTVKIYLEVDHYGGGEPRKVKILLNSKDLWNKPIEQFRGGFQDITSRVSSKDNFPLNRQEHVHALEFNLDDTQPKKLKDTVVIDCVIIVFGKVLFEDS